MDRKLEKGKKYLDPFVPILMKYPSLFLTISRRFHRDWVPLRLQQRATSLLYITYLTPARS